jgi:hypothetical protein
MMGDIRANWMDGSQIMWEEGVEMWDFFPDTRHHQDPDPKVDTPQPLAQSISVSSRSRITSPY